MVYDGTFDGLDFVVVPTRRAGPVVDLYQRLLGFEVESDSDAGHDLARLVGAGDASRTVRLSRGPGAGGAIVVVETQDAPDAEGQSLSGLVPPTRPGPFALDFYLRDAAATEAELERAGWSFTTEAVHYELPGTTIPVRERMLVNGHLGLLHALVQHRPGGTRSVLSESDVGHSSEVVAVVVLTRHLAGARRFAADLLGGREYFRGTFSGEAMERMVGLGPGGGLDASLYRGPGSRNARLEFACPTSGSGELLPLEGAALASVTPGLMVRDLDGLMERLSDGAHGSLSAVQSVDLAGRRRAARLDTSYDVSLLLVDDEVLTS